MLDTLLELYGIQLDWDHVCTPDSHRPALETRLALIPSNVLNTSNDKLLLEFFADMPSQVTVADRIQQLGVPLLTEPTKKRPRPPLVEPPAKRVQSINLPMWTTDTPTPTPADYDAAVPVATTVRPTRERVQTTFLANEQEDEEEEEEKAKQPSRKRKRASKPKANEPFVIREWATELDLPRLVDFNLANNAVLNERIRKRTSGKTPVAPMLHYVKLWNVVSSRVFKPWLDMQSYAIAQIVCGVNKHAFPCSEESASEFAVWCQSAKEQIHSYCNFLDPPPGYRTLRQALLKVKWVRVLGTEPGQPAALELGIWPGRVLRRVECTWEAAIDAHMLMMSLYPKNLMATTAHWFLSTNAGDKEIWKRPEFHREVAETSFRLWWYYQAFFGCSVARGIAETQKPRSIELPTGRAFVHQA